MRRSPSGSSRFRALHSGPACRRLPPPSRFRWRRLAMADPPRETLTRETLTRETWITGVGIVSCLGEGQEAHWQRLSEPPPVPDMKAFAPYIVHPLAPIELDKQIPK